MKTTILALADNAARATRVLALTAVSALVGALLLAPGAGTSASHAATSPSAPRTSGESGLLLAAFNGSATISLSYASGQSGVPTQLTGATIPVSTLSFGATRAFTATSSSAGAGKPVPTDISLSRTVDQYSSALLKELYIGNSATAVVTVQRPVQSGQTSPETLQITLAGSALSSDSENHNGVGGTENLTLYFTRITMAYTSGTGATYQWFYDRNSNTVG